MGSIRRSPCGVLQPVSHRPLLLLYAVLGMTGFFSMWISNTATAAMMLAVIAPMLRRVPAKSRFANALILAVPFGANIGGVGTPIGTPPNAIALGGLREGGFSITFLDWMIMAVPLALLMLLITGALLYVLYRPEPGLTLGQGTTPEPITKHGWMTLAILVLAIAAWSTQQWHGVTDGMIALIAATALAATGVLKREDINTIDWTVLILMWGGLSLGEAMKSTGLLDTVSQLPLATLSGVVLTGLLVVTAMALSTFVSNTATAALLVPVALGFALATQERGQLAVADRPRLLLCHGHANFHTTQCPRLRHRPRQCAIDDPGRWTARSHCTDRDDDRLSCHGADGAVNLCHIRSDGGRLHRDRSCHWRMEPGWLSTGHGMTYHERWPCLIRWIARNRTNLKPPRHHGPPCSFSPGWPHCPSARRPL